MYGSGYKKMVSVRVDEELHERVRAKLAEENKGKWYNYYTFTDIVEDAMKAYLEKTIKKK